MVQEKNLHPVVHFGVLASFPFDISQGTLQVVSGDGILRRRGPPSDVLEVRVGHNQRTSSRLILGGEAPIASGSGGVPEPFTIRRWGSCGGNGRYPEIRANLYTSQDDRERCHRGKGDNDITLEGMAAAFYVLYTSIFFVVKSCVNRYSGKVKDRPKWLPCDSIFS
ncbi:unnamed protein product, partial [Choristocarpus tenellus]